MEITSFSVIRSQPNYMQIGIWASIVSAAMLIAAYVFLKLNFKTF